MDGLSRFAVAGLTVNAIVDALMPNYASAQQVSKTDERIKASTSPCRRRRATARIKGYLVRPFSADTRTATAAKLPGVLVVHENRGLNPHIEDIARRFALANFMAFAPDGLTSVGGYPGDDLKGGELFGKVDAAKKLEDFVASALWLKSAARLHRQDRRDRASATAAASRTRWPCGWAPTWPRPRRSTAAHRRPRTCRRSRPRSWSITASSTRGWSRPGRRTTPR